MASATIKAKIGEKLSKKAPKNLTPTLSFGLVLQQGEGAG